MRSQILMSKKSKIFFFFLLHCYREEILQKCRMRFRGHRSIQSGRGQQPNKKEKKEKEKGKQKNKRKKEQRIPFFTPLFLSNLKPSGNLLPKKNEIRVFFFFFFPPCKKKKFLRPIREAESSATNKDLV